MTAVTVAALGLFVGWTIGLTVHALRCTRWNDPGARLAGGAGAAIVILTGLLLGALGVLVGALAFGLSAVAGALLLIGGAPIGAAAGWWASEKIARVTADDPPPEPHLLHSS